MAKVIKSIPQQIKNFIVNSFRPEEVEVNIKVVGNKVVYTYTKVK
jgi:hypothetical protein